MISDWVGDEDFYEDIMDDTDYPEHVKVLLEAVKLHEEALKELYDDIYPYSADRGYIDFYLDPHHPDYDEELIDLRIWIDFNKEPSLKSVYIGITGDDDVWKQTIPYSRWNPCYIGKVDGEETAKHEF